MKNKTLKTKLLLAFFVSGFFLFGLAGVSKAAILFYEDFEDALDFVDDWAIRPVGHGSQGLTTEQIRYGTKSYKFTLTKFDAGDYREELMLTKHFIPDHNYQNFIIGDEYWIGFSIFLADGYHSPVDYEYVVLHQYHGAGDQPPTCDPAESGRNPVISIVTKNEDWLSSTIWDSRQCATVKGDYEGGTQKNYGAFSTGQWYDFVINVKWSYGISGFMKIWKDGVSVTDRTGPNCFNDKLGPFLRLGIYSLLDQDQTMTIYYDELKIGNASSSYAEVSPGGAPETCESQSGDCCLPLQTCQGGSSVGSSDCSNVCCVGGTCEDPAPTCQTEGYYCCASCESGSQSDYDGDCPGVCCEVCTPQTCAAQSGVPCPVGANCVGGTFVNSSDFGNLCCASPLTCEGEGYKCCSSCKLEAPPEYAGDCPGEVCCAVCSPVIYPFDKAEFKNPVKAKDFSKLIENILIWSLSIVGSLALLMLIIGGVMYIGSTGDEQKVLTAKKIVTYAIIGTVLILLSYSVIKVLGGVLS